MEPPGADLPPRPQVDLSALVRPAAAGAAAALALSSHGNLVLLAALLGVAASSSWSGVACGLGAAAAVVRWGSPDLGALAGDQSVLGAAGLVGPQLAAASSWCAAAAVVLSARGPALAVVPFGATAAALVAGPGELWIRVPATAAGAVIAAAAIWVARRRAGVALGPLAAATGVAAVVLAVIA